MRWPGSAGLGGKSTGGRPPHRTRGSELLPAAQDSSGAALAAVTDEWNGEGKEEGGEEDGDAPPMGTSGWTQSNPSHGGRRGFPGTP